MKKLSFSCIGHNEKEHLQNLLPLLLKHSNEVIYVDCESTDGSFDYAKNCGCNAFKQPNNTNLNVNKSYGFEQAQGEWIFYIDPDERVSKELIKEIKSVISSNPKENAFTLARKNTFFGKWLKFGGQYPDYQLRLFKKTKGKFENKHVHEKLKIDGKIGKLNNDLIHHPYVSIQQMILKFDFYTSFDAQYLNSTNAKLDFKNHFYFSVYKPVSRFIRRYILKMGFRDGVPGFLAALFDAIAWSIRYTKLWEIKKGNNVLLSENKSKTDLTN